MDRQRLKGVRKRKGEESIFLTGSQESRANATENEEERPYRGM